MRNSKYYSYIIFSLCSPYIFTVDTKSEAIYVSQNNNQALLIKKIMKVTKESDI